MPTDMRRSWNRASAAYQKNQQTSTDHATYGPWSPSEKELRLLGDVRGVRILDLGCGGGQNAIAFARQGATVAGIDLSDTQLTFARRLAAQNQLLIEFIRGSAENLEYFDSGGWDVVFSTYTLHYVTEIERCLSECHRVLCGEGRLVFSLDHPFRACFYSEEDDELTPFPARSYFDVTPLRWPFIDSGAEMISYHRTIEAWITLLGQAGFLLDHLLEPFPNPDLLDVIWPHDGALSALRNIPQTVIFVARKV